MNHQQKEVCVVKIRQYENDEPHEKKLVAEIAQRLNQKSKLALEIGEKIAALIALKGGTQYGESTIEELSTLPEIQCSPKQLRRYWGYYRISSLYGDAIRKIAGTLPVSFFYELARLLGADGEAASETADPRTRKQIEKYVAWKVAQDSAGRYVTVDDFCQEISDGIGKAGKVKDDPAKAPLSMVDKKNSGQRKHTRIGGILAYDDEGLETMASYFSEFAAPHHLASSKLNPGRVGHQVNRMADALAALIDYLLAAKETSEIDAATPVTLLEVATKLNAVLVKDGAPAAHATEATAAS